MVTAIILQIILGFTFLILAFFIFTLPGFYLLKKLKINSDHLIERIASSTVVGFVVFTLSAYILAALHLRFAMYLFVVISLYVFYKTRLLIFKGETGISREYLKYFLPILIIGIIMQVAVNAPSGFFYNNGINFYSSHGHDGVWHLALMESMKSDVFPFQNPEFSGKRLQNYHFFVDLLMSEMSRLFKFSNLDVYFRFLPIIFSILLGLSSYTLGKLWAKKESAGLWSMIFVYFCGSFGYLLTLPRSQNLVGSESIFWVSQTQSVLGNPPHAAAFIILIVYLVFLYKYFEQKNLKLIIPLVLLGGAVIEFKVYAGTLILGGLLVAGLWNLIIKRGFQTLLLFALTLIVAVVIYLPNSSNSQDFLVWQPWWFIRTMIVAPDRLNWLDLELRRQTYIAENNLKRVIQIELTGFLLFLLGNLGMRILGFWTVFKLLKKSFFSTPFSIYYLSITTAAFIIPVLFVQKGVAWNVIQYNQYFLLLFGFLAAIAVSDLIHKVKRFNSKLLISFLILLFAIPTQIGLLWQFYSNKPLSQVSYEELDALNHLKSVSSPNDLVLTAPFNQYAAAKYFPPLPISTWYTTGYVSAFSGRTTLLSDSEQVDIMGYDYKSILEDQKRMFEEDKENPTKNLKFASEFFKKYNISYIYLAYDQKLTASESLLPLDLIYQSPNVKIFKVKQN